MTNGNVKREPGRAVSLILAGCVLFPVLLLVGGGPGSEAKNAIPAVAALQQRISGCISQRKYEGAFWGIKVVSLDRGKTLFEHNAKKLFSPASNTKLYTVALALDRLGPDYRIKTSLFAPSKPDASGTVEGDLILFGRGDPTINARLHGGDILKALEPLVAALTNSGVKRITADLVGDQSFFRGPEFGSGWAWDDTEYYYGAEISALTINDNILRATVRPGESVGQPCAIGLEPATSYLALSNRTQTLAADAKRSISFYRPLNENIVYVSGGMAAGATNFTEELTMHNPAGLFASFYRQALEQHGVRVEGRVRTVDWLERQVAPLDFSRLSELGSVASLPMRDIAREIEKVSQNLYTDLLLAHVGENFRTIKDPAEMTSEELGVRELKKFLAEAGISTNEYFFEEGSGLSRDTLVTPNATVSLLAFMNRHQHSRIYLDALPIAGVDGSLRNRMKNTPAAGNARAKTGSLRWASSLSGYVTTAAGERLAFSLMLNRYDPGPDASAHEDLDAITVMLAGLTAKSD